MPGALGAIRPGASIRRCFWIQNQPERSDDVAQHLHPLDHLLRKITRYLGRLVAPLGRQKQAAPGLCRLD